jgi:hypothetical protein
MNTLPAKFVVVTELKMGLTKSNSEYPYILDQDKVRWNLFPPLPKVELNKCYVFYFEEANGFQNVKEIAPVVNIMKQKALKELANRNDYKKDFMMCVSYSKDCLMQGIIKREELFTFAEEIYNQVNSLTDKYMPKEENNETKN